MADPNRFVQVQQLRWRNANPHTDADPKSDTDANADCNGDTKPQSDANPDPDCHRDTKPEPDTHRHSDTEPESDANRAASVDRQWWIRKLDFALGDVRFRRFL